MKSLVPLGVAALLAATAHTSSATYDPLAVDPNFNAQVLELTVPAPEGSIPVRIYLPVNSAPAPVVLFSHGLGGSRNGNTFLGQHWAGRGYVAVFLQHPGSDSSVWQGKPFSERMSSLVAAASLKNFVRRARDVHAALDALTSWNSDPKSPLSNCLDLERIGMSGHSFGAVTTEAVSGETFPVLGTKLTDSRIKAAIAFSPSAPLRDTPEAHFSSENSVATDDRNKGRVTAWPDRRKIPTRGLSRIESCAEIRSRSEQRGAFRVH